MACDFCTLKNDAANCGAKITAKEFKSQRTTQAPAANNADPFGQSKWEDMQSAKYSRFIAWLEAQKPDNNFDETAELAISVRAILEEDRMCPLRFD